MSGFASPPPTLPSPTLLHPAASPAPQAASRPLPARSPAARSALVRRWQALGEAAAVVAVLAGKVAEDDGIAVPEAIAATGGWRLHLAEQGLADITAIMETGIRALLAIHASGALDYARQVAAREAEAAKAAISHLKDSNYRKALLQLCLFAVERKH